MTAPQEMRVRFLRDRDFTPPEDRRVTWAFRKGDEKSIRRTHGEALVASGDAEEMPPPARDDEPKPKKTPKGE